ncbi:MAG: Mut7-C RNAse domain-containing protein [Desulfobacterales bacterium]|nr:Mut7-C RNAse domain-containing protein [Desulfobacterales bacterium]
MKFIADRMLGKLAKELRMLGYDTVYYRGEDAYPLIKLAREEGRVILTRTTKLTPKRPEDRIVRIMEDKPSFQLRELIQIKIISLYEETPFSRCLVCNILLNEMPREEAEGKVPDFIFYQRKKFFRCPQCSRIYWQGSHQDHMQKKIEELKNIG